MTTLVIKNRIDFNRKRCFWGLFTVCFCLCLSYGFLINKAILSAVSQEKVSKEISFLSSSLDQMESNYLNIKSKFTLDFALSHGFVVVSSDKFVSALPSRSGLSLLTNENQ